MRTRARVMELVDISDLKSEAFRACGFDSRPAHHAGLSERPIERCVTSGFGDYAGTSALLRPTARLLSRRRSVLSRPRRAGEEPSTAPIRPDATTLALVSLWHRAFAIGNHVVVKANTVPLYSMPRNDPPLPDDFLCPHCGSNKGVYVLYENDAGKVTRMPWYSCAGCTAMFTDPSRFRRLMRRTVIPGDRINAFQVIDRPMIGDPDPPPAWERSRGQDEVS